MGKPATAEGYDLETTRHAIATCIYVATKLGDLMDDMVVRELFYALASCQLFQRCVR